MGCLGEWSPRDFRELRPCYTVHFSQQLVSQCRCETSCWRIAQCNMGCLAIFSLREALHEVELRSTFRNGLQQLTTSLHSVSPVQQLVSQFYSSFTAVLTRAHVHTYYISFRGALPDKLLRKLHSVTGPQHQTSATCNATFLIVARQVAEKFHSVTGPLNALKFEYPKRILFKTKMERNDRWIDGQFTFHVHKKHFLKQISTNWQK